MGYPESTPVIALWPRMNEAKLTRPHWQSFLLRPFVGGGRGSASLGQTSSRRIPPMPQIHPCLWFDGQAEEAMGFYVSVFPN